MLIHNCKALDLLDILTEEDTPNLNQKEKDNGQQESQQDRTIRRTADLGRRGQCHFGSDLAGRVRTRSRLEGIVENNCGIGPNGFEKDNVCAKGGGIKSTGAAKYKKGQGSPTEACSKWIKEALGLRKSIKDIFKIAGVPDTATATFYYSGDHGEKPRKEGNYMEVSYYDEKLGVSAVREIHYDLDDQGKLSLVVHNKYFEIINPGKQGKGTGTAIFSVQVENAKKAGISHIRTSAARSIGMNGYYTWAVLGYEGNVFVSNSAKKRLGIKYDPNKDELVPLSELMSTAEGREYWKKEGTTFEGIFDLSSNSKSLRILRKYIKAKKAKEALATNVFCATGIGGGVDPSCSPSESTFNWKTDKSVWISKTGKVFAFKSHSLGNRELLGDKYDPTDEAANYDAMEKLGYGRVIVEKDGSDYSLSADRKAVSSKQINALKSFARRQGMEFTIYIDDKPTKLVRNVFCPTGEGGGVDPTCSPGGAGTAVMEKPISKKATPEGRAHLVKKMNVWVEEISKRTGQAEMDVWEGFKSDPSDYESLLTEMKSIYAKADPHAWIPIFKNDSKNLSRQEDETDEEFKERIDTHTIASQVRNNIASSMSDTELPLKTRKEYLAAVDTVLSSVLTTGGPQVVRNLATRIDGVSWHKDMDSLNDYFASVDPYAKELIDKGYEIGGAYSDQEKRLYLDGGGRGQLSAEIYSHEFGHAMDMIAGSLEDISETEEWFEAASAEAANLSAYATTSPDETFAEFSRYLWGFESPDIQEAARVFPKMTKVFQKHQLLKNK